MGKLLRTLSLAWALGLFPAYGHAAWTDTTVPGVSATDVGFHPLGIFVYTPVGGAMVLNKEANTQWLVRLDTGVLAATKQWNIGVQPNVIALHPGGNQLLVADDDGKRLLRYSIPTRTLIETIPIPFEPAALAFNADGSRLIVASEERIFVLDTATRTKLGSVPIDDVKAIDFWPAGDRAVAVDHRAVYVINIATGAFVRVPAGSGLTGVAVDPVSGMAYATDRHTNAVAVVDLNTRTYRGRYALPDEPAGIAFDPINSRVLVTLKKLGQLARLDPATAVLLPSLFLGQKLTGIAVDNVADKAVALTGRRKAFVIDLADRTTTDIALPGKPKAVGVDESRQLAILGLNQALGLHFVDLATSTLLAETVPLDTNARAIAVDSSRGLAVVVVKRKNQLVLVDIPTRQLLATLAIPGDFKDVAVHSGKGRAYVVNQAKGIGEVVILDLTTRTVAGTIAVSKDAESIVVDEALDQAVVAIEEKNKLEVIDLNTNLVIASYPLTKHPRSLALNPMTHTVVVTAKDSDQIALLDLAAQTITPLFAAIDKPMDAAVTTRFNNALVIGAEKGEILFVPLPNPVPVLTEIVPLNVSGASSLKLLAVGDFFIDATPECVGAGGAGCGSKVVLNGEELSTRWIDAQHLEADVPAAVLATPGTYPVKIVSAAPGGGESATLTFTVENPAPTLTVVAPAELQANSLNQNIALTGNQFVPQSQVFFGAQLLATTFVSATQLTAVVPGTLLNQSGSVPVTVFNPAPGGGTSAPFIVTVVGSRPTITSFTPTEGPLGTLVTITGTNFDALNPGSNDVRFNGVPSVVASATQTELKVIVPTAATTGTISVTTEGGSVTSTGVFTVRANQDFDLELTPASIQVPVSGFGSTRVKLTSVGLAQYTQLASLSVTGLPLGVTFTLSRPGVYLNQDAIVTFATDGSAAPGTYTVTLTAEGQSDIRAVTRTKTLTLQVLDATATTVSGRVLNAADDSPMVGARVRLGSQDTFTDATGAYRFVNPSVIGDQVLLVDGGVLNTPEVEFPSAIPMPVMIEAGKDNLALTVFLQGIDPRKFTAIVPGAQAQVTDPEIPNFSLNIPSGAVLIGLDGTPIDKINVRTVPVDRLPIKPLPPEVDARTVYLYYFFRAGGANPTTPIPVTMINDIGALPGEKVDLWYYDESLTPDLNSNQWRIMGTGTVTEDGKSIVSDPGVGIPKFCCGASTVGNRSGPDENGAPGGEGAPDEPAPDQDDGSGDVPDNHFGNPWDYQGPYGPYPSPNTSAGPNTGPSSPPTSYDGAGNGLPSPPPYQPTAMCGNPVDVTNGAASVFEPRPFGINGLSSVDLRCRYRSTSSRIGFFGRGTHFSYDWFAEQVGSQAVRVTTPAGVRYLLSLGGDGVYRATTGRAGALGMEVVPSANGRTLRLKGGTEYDFNLLGRLIARRSKAGNTVRFTLDANGFIQSITDGSGNVYSIETTRIQIGRTIFTLVARMTDPLGRSQNFTYDAQARITSVTDAGGFTTTYAYDASNRITAKTDPRGAVTQYEYDASGRTVREILPDGANFTFDYTVAANTVTETKVTDPNGNVTIFRFNGQGYEARRVDALGRVFTSEIDYATNVVTATTDALGRVSRYTYDQHGNRTSVIDPDGNTTITEYDPRLNRATKIINALGHATLMTYDERGKVSSVTNPEGETIRYTYTPRGLVQTITGPLGQVTRFEYDVEGNLINSTDPLGRVAQRQYDAANRLIEAIDKRGRSTHYTYDTLNRLSDILDALGNHTLFSYDARDNLLTVTDPRGVVIETNAYDLRNRLTARTDALGQNKTFAYDQAGNRTALTDKKGQVTNITYDALNRISNITYADGRTANYSYDLAGNLTRVSDSVSGECLFVYDSLNRLISETSDRGVVAYQYDAIGRITERRINGADPTTYAYDTANRIKTITYRNQSVTYTYDAAGRLTERTLPNGIIQAFTYNEANELLSLTYKKADGTIIEQVSYTYDLNGNPIARNRTQLGSVPETPFTATYDANNRMLTYNGQPLSYDTNGNLVSRQTAQGIITYTWDAQDRLIGVSGPNGTASFQYDYRGRRIEKTINGITTAFLYDGAQAIAELQGSAIGTTYLTGLQIDEVLARYSASGNRTLLTDALGSILAQTDDSQTQTQTTLYAYSPYGEATRVGENDNSLQYTGRENDETGLYYYRARYYDPGLKRFISSDPIGLRGGLNTYAYVRNNPLRFVDPSGLVAPFPSAVWVYLGDFVGGANDFRKNFNDMNTTLIDRADKYFHCKANCEAAKRGPGGVAAACLLSDIKEFKDVNWSGHPPSDSAEDQAANEYGRGWGANTNLSCDSACQFYRPDMLPSQY